ncbi:hypothetical protein COB57_06325 [Candidatus Peregrinibacteria bacterium]|nr:MAG: hypothetical protein COB57_06325 [Candidatus Peregrinibacteria bacterium]
MNTAVADSLYNIILEKNHQIQMQPLSKDKSYEEMNRVEKILFKERQREEKRAQAIAAQYRPPGIMEQSHQFARGYLRGLKKWSLEDLMEEMDFITSKAVWVINFEIYYIFQILFEYIQLLFEFILQPSVVMEDRLETLDNFVEKGAQHIIQSLQLLEKKWISPTAYDLGFVYGRMTIICLLLVMPITIVMGINKHYKKIR